MASEPGVGCMESVRRDEGLHIGQTSKQAQRVYIKKTGTYIDMLRHHLGNDEKTTLRVRSLRRMASEPSVGVWKSVRRAKGLHIGQTTKQAERVYIKRPAHTSTYYATTLGTTKKPPSVCGACVWMDSEPGVGCMEIRAQGRRPAHRTDEQTSTARIYKKDRHIHRHATPPPWERRKNHPPCAELASDGLGAERWRMEIRGAGTKACTSDRRPSKQSTYI